MCLMLRVALGLAFGDTFHGSLLTPITFQTLYRGEKNYHKSRGRRYEPHQGEREKARRRRQTGKKAK